MAFLAAWCNRREYMHNVLPFYVALISLIHLVHINREDI